ncbi:TPA: hypothetical protein SMR48_003275 [Pseudomonas putida]|nr:hypothetical protein [Pseudomonas putida]
MNDKEFGSALYDLKGRYLLVSLIKGTGGAELQQGILEAVDLEGGTFVLRSTVYEGRKDTLAIADTYSIDTSRSGLGAVNSLSKPGWVRSDTGGWERQR